MELQLAAQPVERLLVKCRLADVRWDRYWSDPRDSREPGWQLHRKDTKLTKVRFAMALGTLLLLFAATYGPAFLTVALLKVRPFEAVPAIIVTNLAVAILLIKVVSGTAGGFAQFGFRFCHHRYISAAIVFGVPIAWALTILINHLSSSPPPELSLRPWMTFLYF